MRVQIEMKSSHLPWARKEHIIKDIDLQNIFNGYWYSNEHELTVLGQSWFPASPLIADRKAQRLLTSESIIAL
jgi:hypothetical protein